MIDLCLINRDNEEMIADIKQLFPPQYHSAVVTEIFNVALEKLVLNFSLGSYWCESVGTKHFFFHSRAAKDVAILAKSLLHLVSTNTISPDNFVLGAKETFEFAPDLYIDIPMLYEYLGKFIAPQIEKKVSLSTFMYLHFSNWLYDLKSNHTFSFVASISHLNKYLGYHKRLYHQTKGTCCWKL